MTSCTPGPNLCEGLKGEILILIWLTVEISFPSHVPPSSLSCTPCEEQQGAVVRQIVHSILSYLDNVIL